MKPFVMAAPLLPNYLTQAHFAEFVLNFNYKWMEQTSRFNGIEQWLSATEQHYLRTQCSEAYNKPEETLARDYPDEDNCGERGLSPRGRTAETGTRGTHGRPSNVLKILSIYNVWRCVCVTHLVTLQCHSEVSKHISPFI